MQVTQENTTDRPWFYNRNKLQLAADTVSSALWWHTIDLFLYIYPTEIFKIKQYRAVGLACEWFLDCDKVRLLQWHMNHKREDAPFRE